MRIGTARTTCSFLSVSVINVVKAFVSVVLMPFYKPVLLPGSRGIPMNVYCRNPSGKESDMGAPKRGYLGIIGALLVAITASFTAIAPATALAGPVSDGHVQLAKCTLRVHRDHPGYLHRLRLGSYNLPHGRRLLRFKRRCGIRGHDLFFL